MLLSGDLCAPQIANNLRLEVFERATNDILVALLFDCLLPCFLCVSLSPFLRLHLDAQSVMTTMSDKQNEVCDTCDYTFSFQNAPGRCAASAAVRHREEQQCELRVCATKPIDAINLQRAFLVTWVRTAVRLGKLLGRYRLRSDSPLAAQLSKLLHRHSLRCACRAVAACLR